jgi:hypothetical protein
VTLSRLLNWPDTLAELDGVWQKWDPNALKERLRERTASGAKVFNAAYVVTTCGKKMEKTDYVVDVANNVNRVTVNRKPPHTLQGMYDLLRTVDGLSAGFLAGQIIADLKNTPGYVLADAPDWWSWCVPGPGSNRGLNRLMGMDIDDRKWKPQPFGIHISTLRHLIAAETGLKLCAQDVQNCLCEFDKYMRALEGGRPKQLYPGRA